MHGSAVDFVRTPSGCVTVRSRRVTGYRTPLGGGGGTPQILQSAGAWPPFADRPPKRSTTDEPAEAAPVDDRNSGSCRFA